MAEKLVDFEDYFRRWRFNHVTTVERVIGLKRGTGGTGGVSYLRRMLDVELFPELWHLRTTLVEQRADLRQRCLGGGRNPRTRFVIIRALETRALTLLFGS